MKAIETFYNGYRFRSRLEARWAVFFDAMDVRYKYEPEGFVLGDGTCYLPDFYLPDLNIWVEAKGQLTNSDIKKIELFRNELSADSKRFLWVVGDIPTSDWFEPGGLAYEYGNIFSIGNEHVWDSGFIPCVCPVCGKFGIEFEGRGARVCPQHCPDSDKEYTANNPKILAAYDKARRARFEHGENG